MGKPNRYTPPPGAESEAQPGSRGRVLRNLLGITRVRAMDKVELAALINAQSRWLHDPRLTGRLTARLLCEMHRQWLGEVYAWAGAYRSVDLAKGGFRWPPARLVAQNMAAFEQETLSVHTPCPAEEIAQTARRMAIVHAEFLLIHPFREGNGRMARWIADVMALQANRAPPKYNLAGKAGRQYIVAVQRGYLRDYDRLTEFFRRAVRAGLPRFG